MKVVGSGAFVVLLAGCAAVPSGPAQPTPSSVQATVADVAAISTDPVTAWQAGDYAVRAACDAYLNQAAARAAGITTASAGLGLGGTTAAGFLAAAGNPAGAAAAASMAAVGQSFLSLFQSPGAMPYTPETSAIIGEAMSAYEDAVPPPTTLAQAMIDVEGFWDLCSPAGYQQLITKAIGSAAVTASPGPNAAAQSQALFQGAPPVAFREAPVTATASPPRVLVNGR